MFPLTPDQIRAQIWPNGVGGGTPTQRQMDRLMAWRSGNVLCRINEVTLRRARLVLGWVTVYGQVNHLGTKPAS